jgi:hypothetical protein
MKKQLHFARSYPLTVVALICMFIGTGTAQSFKHPGIANTKEELDLIKAKVNAGQQPWLSGYEKMMSDSVSSLSFTPNPCDHFTFDSCRTQLRNDGAAAYSHALQWYIKGNEANARKSIEILNAWVAKLRNFDQSCLAVTWGMPRMINAAEIMRIYPGWSSTDIGKFKSWLSDLVWPFASGCESDRSNWDAGGIALSLEIAVFTDNRSRFDSSVERLRNFIPVYVKSSGCTNETDRDQAHAQMGIGFLADGCEIAWHQGVDAWAFHDNRLYKGYELTAKYNLGESISCPDVGGVSSQYRGEYAPIWEIAYNHYHNRKGMDMPYSRQVVAKIRPEGRDIHQMPWGTLTHAEVRNGISGGTPTPTPTITPVTPTPTPDIPGCLSARGGSSWINYSFVNQTGTFTAIIDAIPSISPSNMHIGLSNGAQSGYSGFAAIIRFNTAGNIDARNGGAYSAASAIPYAASIHYKFRVVVNVPAHTYSVYVTSEGGTERIVGENFAFRTEQASVSQLNNLGAFTDASSGSLHICYFEIGQPIITLIDENCSLISNFTRVSGGTWGSSNGQCTLTAAATCTSPLCNILTHNTSVSGDFTLTAEGAAAASSNAWDDFAVVFGYVDASNYYYASFNESDDANTNGIFRVQAGAKTQVVDFGSNVTAPGTTLHAIKVVKLGSTINVYKGSALIGTLSGESLTSGKVGFASFNNNATFDNLKVTKP